MCVCTCSHVLWCACWRSEDYSNFSSTVGSWDWTWLSGLCSRCLYLSAEPEVVEVLKTRFWIIQICWEPKDLYFFFPLYLSKAPNAALCWQDWDIPPLLNSLFSGNFCFVSRTVSSWFSCLRREQRKTEWRIHLASSFILRYESPSCVISLCTKEVGALF